MDQIAKKPVERVPPFTPRVRKTLKGAEGVICL